MIYVKKERKDKPSDTQIYVCLCVSKFNEHQSEFYQLAAYDKEADKWTCETKSFTVVGWLSEVTDMKELSDVIIELDYESPQIPLSLVDKLRTSNPWAGVHFNVTKSVVWDKCCNKLQELITTSAPQPHSLEGEDQETLWDEFFDQIVWDERESNHDVTQIMNTLQRKYHITRKQPPPISISEDLARKQMNAD
jgi:hypothetical protein